MAESKEETKSLLMKAKEREEAGLKLNIQKADIQSYHFMANSWGKNGNNDRFCFLGSNSPWRVTVAMKFKDFCSLEGKL